MKSTVTGYLATTRGRIEIRTQKPYLRIKRDTRVLVTDECPTVRKDNGKRCMRGYVEFYLVDELGLTTSGPLYTGGGLSHFRIEADTSARGGVA